MANRRSVSYRAVPEFTEAKELVQQVVCRLKDKLPEECGLRVNSITCGGTLGVGTSCVGHLNSELTIYSPDINPKDIERRGCEDWLNKIHRLFQSDQVLSESYQFHAVTETALEFDMEGVEVELMVSPYWVNPASFYTFMDTIKHQHRTKFFHCAAKWQTMFLKQQPNQDHRLEFVRRALAWRELKWSRSTGGQGRPSSYLLTLLVLKAHEDALKRLGVFSTLSPDTMALHTAEELKRIVYNHSTIDIYWEHCYSLRQHPTLAQPRPPRVLDPANPANNLYVTGVSSFGANERPGEHRLGGANWSALKYHIGGLDLSKPADHWI